MGGNPLRLALDIKNLTHAYGNTKPALDDVSLAAPLGQFTALLGPNGAGKTTLIALLTRLFERRTGRISVCGYDLQTHASEALARIGIVFQQPTLDLDLTVEQNLNYFAALHGVAPKRAKQRIERELTRLDMIERRREKIRQLNGGHRRRVEIARALLHEPELLILDEPTVGLDIPTRQKIVDHLHQLADRDGIGVLWATHLIDEVADNDNVIVLHKGKILAHGKVPDIIAQADAADLAGAFNRLIAA